MGEFRIDHATIAFRLALAEASEQEQARADALSALWPRSVFAATWPSPNEAPRTLTNSHGETALPLFTGMDTLEVGADRFSWREPNGSIRFREMSAREALRYALTRQVNFVVLDVGFEHNVEFAREEFEPLVLDQEGDAGRQVVTRPATTSPPSTASVQARQSIPVGTRQTPSSGVPQTPVPSAPQSGAAAARPRSDPAAQAKPASSQRASSPGSAPGSARSRPSPAGPQHEAGAPTDARQVSSVPPNLSLTTSSAHDVSPRMQSGAVPIQQSPEPAPRQRSGAVPIQQPPSDTPGAERPRPGSAPARQRTISASPPPPSAYPVAPPESASSKPPEPPRTTPGVSLPLPRNQVTLTQSEFVTPANQQHAVPPPAAGARQHTVPIHTPPPSAAGQRSPSAPRHPTPQPTVPPPRAADVRRTPPPVPEAAKSRTPSTPGVPAPIIDVPPTRPANEQKLPDARRRTRDDEPTLAERPNRANTQRGLSQSVPDTALEALSSELRGFPEVEWACVLSDESEVPLIGVRIDPSFLNRVADITDVILDVGERQAVALQVLLLNNQDQVKNARRNGRAFYPWVTGARP